MPQPLDDAYNAALRDAFVQALRAPDGDLAQLLQALLN